MGRKKDIENTPELEREIQITRYRDILIFVPCLIALVFLTPILNFAPAQVHIFGVPLKITLIFGVWAGAVFIVFLTNKKLSQKMDEREP